MKHCVCGHAWVNHWYEKADHELFREGCGEQKDCDCNGFKENVAEMQNAE